MHLLFTHLFIKKYPVHTCGIYVHIQYVNPGMHVDRPGVNTKYLLLPLDISVFDKELLMNLEVG